MTRGNTLKRMRNFDLFYYSSSGGLGTVAKHHRDYCIGFDLFLFLMAVHSVLHIRAPV